MVLIIPKANLYWCNRVLKWAKRKIRQKRHKRLRESVLRGRQQRCTSAWDEIKSRSEIADKQMDVAIAELGKPRPDMKKVRDAEQMLQAIISDTGALKNNFRKLIRTTQKSGGMPNPFFALVFPSLDLVQVRAMSMLQGMREKKREKGL